ncbi:ADP-ribosylhydrolase ARH1-like [Saccostrea cucullata]|uniref:ADP-ribosylhydrolase ARH1-like n=1 Tax=Saccostrea cuccullata TaxID=36930 RepID=UPI002ED677A6
MVSMRQRYEAAMVLSAAGDALGYKNGSWEFCHHGKEIIKELKALGGLNSILVKPPKWIVSDDTVMHLATSEALTKCKESSKKDELFREIARNYKQCMKDMRDRAPGNTCCSSVHQLHPDRPDWRDGCRIKFFERGGGCGAAMRAMCIGLRYPHERDLSDLIAVSVESGRMTHHHPTGYLGSLAAALFTAYAIQGKPPREWGAGLMKVLPTAKEYIKSENFYVEDNLEAWNYFEEHWQKYLKEKNLLEGTTDPEPDNLDEDGRDNFYKSLSYSGWGGSSGHDAPMIAYDAILQSGKNWEELCKRSMFHGGDSDSTGVIAACCYGAMYGYEGVPEVNHKSLEYRKRLVKEAKALYELAHGSGEEDFEVEEDDTIKEEDEKAADTTDMKQEVPEKESDQEEKTPQSENGQEKDKVQTTV